MSFYINNWGNDTCSFIGKWLTDLIGVHFISIFHYDIIIITFIIIIIALLTQISLFIGFAITRVYLFVSILDWKKNKTTLRQLKEVEGKTGSKSLKCQFFWKSKRSTYLTPQGSWHNAIHFVIWKLEMKAKTWTDQLMQYEVFSSSCQLVWQPDTNCFSGSTRVSSIDLCLLG